MKKVTDRQLLSDGHVVFREGQPASVLYLVTQGEVELYKQVGNAQQLIMTCKVGEFIGVNTLVSQRNYSATAKVKGAAAIILVSQETVAAQLLKLDKLTLNIMTSVVDRLNGLLDEKTQNKTQ